MVLTWIGIAFMVVVLIVWMVVREPAADHLRPGTAAAGDRDKRQRQKPKNRS